MRDLGLRTRELLPEPASTPVPAVSSLPPCFLRGVAEEDPEDDKREQVEEIEIAGSRADHDDPDDSHAKGDEEFFCKE